MLYVKKESKTPPQSRKQCSYIFCIPPGWHQCTESMATEDYLLWDCMILLKDVFDDESCMCSRQTLMLLNSERDDLVS